MFHIRTHQLSSEKSIYNLNDSMSPLLAPGVHVERSSMPPAVTDWFANPW